MIFFRRTFLISALISVTAWAESPDYNRDVRPILSENCFLCHGQDPKHRGGDLRLDVREDAVADRDDGAAIVPGTPKPVPSSSA